MARPKTDPTRAPTRERILSGGRSLFSDDGFERATLAAIGRRAGISRPSVLHHFESKDLLYRAVVMDVFEELGAALWQAMTLDSPFEQQLEGLVSAFERYLATHRASARIIVRELLGNGPGAAIVMEQVSPLLERVVSFITSAGHGVLRQDLPVRQAVLQVASTALLAHAAGEAGQSLWKGETQSLWLTRTLFLTTGASS